MKLQSLLRPVGGNDGWTSWAREVSRALDGLSHVSMGSMRSITATAPVPAALGPTSGWIFTVAPQVYLYAEFAIQPSADRSKPLILGLGWTATGNEVGKTCKWTLDIGLEYPGSDISAIDISTSQTVNVPEALITYARTAFVLTPDQWDGGTDELHVRVTREASAADPVADPGLHHLVMIQQLAP